MAIRQDQVQLRVDFITDESRQLARTLLTTKQYNDEIASSTNKIKEYQNQLKKAGEDEAKRATILSKIAAEEKKVADNLGRIAQEGKKVEALDLNKLAPAQLIQRAKQLQQAIRLIPASSPQFAQLQGELGKVNTRLREINQTARGAAAAAPTGGGGIGGLITTIASGGIRAIPIIGQIVAGVTAIGGALKKASDFEQLTISFETFLGSAEKAKVVVQDLRKFADVTPFETEQVNKAGRALLAFGFNTRELIPVLTRVGDVAAGTGKDFNELALIYGKAKAQGLIQGEELNQLAEAGIPIYAELAKVLGVNESQIRKLGEQGRIQFSDLEQVFVNLTSQGSRFGGLMERQSKSLGGLFSTLKSSFSNFFTEIGLVLAPLVKRALELLIDGMSLLMKVSKPVFELFRFGFQASVNVGKEIATLISETIPQAITKWVKSAEQIPIIGKAISALLVPVRLVIDAIESLPATVSGVAAALNDIFTTGGRNAGQAYGEARRRALEEERQQAARDAAEAARDERQLSASERAAIEEEERKAAAERALRKQKEDEATKKRLDAALAVALKAVEADAKRRELVLENARIKDEISEERYNEGLTAIRERELNAQLEVYRNFRRDQVNEALALQNELAAIQAGRDLRNQAPLETLPGRGLGQVTQQSPGAIPDVGREALETALRQKFQSALITEQEYQLQSLELKRLFLEEELAILRAATPVETEEVKKREEQKRDIELQIGEQRLENELRIEQLRQQAIQEGTKALGDVFQVAADLLTQDEKKKQKHAGVIKALQIANIQVNLAAEISGIYANAQKSAIAQLLGPVAGAVLANVQAALAVVRAGVQSAKIQSTKFAGGGYTGSGYGAPDETGHRPAGVVHDGEYVVPKRIVSRPEAGPVLRWLESKRLRGYADGGLVTVNTTPIALPSTSTQVNAALSNLDTFVAAVEVFNRTVAQFPTEVRSRIVYTDIEDAGTELNAVRDDAAV